MTEDNKSRLTNVGDGSNVSQLVRQLIYKTTNNINYKIGRITNIVSNNSEPNHKNIAEELIKSV